MTFDVVALAVLFVSTAVSVYVRNRIRTIDAVSSKYYLLTDSVHFGLGFSTSQLPVEYLAVVSALYVIYQLADYVRNSDNVDKDVGAYLAGVLAGLGYDIFI